MDNRLKIIINIMNTELLGKLKEEIEADIDGRYIGKTAKELVDLINNPFAVEEAKKEVLPEEVKNTITVTKDAPVFRVIMGIPEAPNVVTEEDITNALK